MRLDDYQSNEYNNSRLVEVAETALKGNPSLSDCFSRVSEIIRNNKLESIFGLWLVHKHFDLENGQKLVETAYYTDKGRIEIAAEALNDSDTPSHVVPHRFAVEETDNGCKLIPLEYTDDPITVRNYANLDDFSSSIEEICSLISSSGLSKVLGLCMIGERDALGHSDNSILAEQTPDIDKRKNVSALIKKEIGSNDDEFIKTNWRFSHDNDEAVATVVCFRICTRYSPGHSVSHRRMNCTTYV